MTILKPDQMKVAREVMTRRRDALGALAGKREAIQRLAEKIVEEDRDILRALAKGGEDR